MLKVQNASFKGMICRRSHKNKLKTHKKKVFLSVITYKLLELCDCVSLRRPCLLPALSD